MSISSTTRPRPSDTGMGGGVLMFVGPPGGVSMVPAAVNASGAKVADSRLPSTVTVLFDCVS